MANKIKLGRATKTRIENIKTTLDNYELVYSTDTNELGVKKPDGNVEYIGSGIDLDEIGYMNHAAKIFYDSNKQNQFKDAWTHSLTVDPSEIERNSTTSIQYGTLQYPNGEDNGVIIPDSVTSIGKSAFYYWSSNNQPLVIPNSVTSIGDYAFYNWEANNQPLVIPNSVTSIGDYAFRNWEANNQPLVIPNSVTSIGIEAFYYWGAVPYIIVERETPPALASSNAFSYQNNAPIYVPDESVDAYKTATNWSALSSRIFSISDKADLMDDIADLQENKQDKLVAGDNITINPTTNVISASGGGGHGGGIPEAPIDDKLYGRKNAAWSEVISGGGEGIDLNEMAYFNYAGSIYGAKYNLLANAWQDMKDSETVLFDIPLALAAPNQNMGGMTIDLYVGTNGQLQALYDSCANGTIPPPISSDNRDVYYVNNVATSYNGDVSGDIGFPIPLYNFGNFGYDNTSFLVGDLTPLGVGLGLVLAKNVNVSIPNNNIVIQQGFEFENESGIIIPDSVTSISAFAFSNWETNNHPLVIPNSVTSIGGYAFNRWEANNQPLVIPNSVTSIGEYAFLNWTSNNQPLVIPNSVTSIGVRAFSDWYANNQPLVIPNSVTSIGVRAFYNWEANNQPLVIPNSVTNIGDNAFYNWEANNQPLVIPNSVTSIGEYAFSYWKANNQPLVIPNSVTSIGVSAFYYWELVPYVEIQAITPPQLVSADAFSGQKNAPIYVPHNSVNTYKNATNWSVLSSRIFSINNKP